VSVKTPSASRRPEFAALSDARARSVELRAKEWDTAARVRECALADAREHVNLLLQELATDRASLRARDARISDLES
jgi:hypothetical protein